jgi:hypothetical protein
MTTINYKGFTIDAELGDDPRVDITITKTIRGEEYIGSVGAAEHEGLSNHDWTKQIQVPVAVIKKAYDLESSLLNN